MRKLARTYGPIRWYNSLVFRVIVLCVVLFLCLLGSVSVITRHYFTEVVQEMEIQTQEIAGRVMLHLQENEEADLSQLERDMMEAYDGTRVELSSLDDTAEVTAFMLERDDQGQLFKVARLPVTVHGKRVLLTARVAIVPQTEILRAFKNKYLAVLTLVFVAALCVLVYFIAHIMRPLTELSDSLAQISSGHLEDVSTRHTSGEIRQLEQTFNQMVGSLREKEVVEANLRQAQRLSSIGNLAAGVAHDVRNPLNAIKLLSSHALDLVNESGGAENETTQRAARQLKTIRDEVNRLEEIVSGFLSLARERELKPEPTRIDTVLEECLRLIRKDAEERDIRLTSELRAGETSLMVDPKHLTRAVLNVLINAMEACPAEGRVRLFSRVTDQTCEIEVRDDGPGMPKDVAERVFDPYYTTKKTGTGLGLSITRGIVEEHEGSIRITSDEEQGCQVLITLPLKMENL